MNQLKQISTKLDVIAAALEPQSEPSSRARVPVFPPRARPFNPELSAKLDTLLVLEESAETLSERRFWRNLRERESGKIYNKFSYVGGCNEHQRISSAF